MKADAPTLADACVATAFGKDFPSTTRAAPLRKFLLSVAQARKFVLDSDTSRFLADLSDNFWPGGLKKRLRMLENARRFARSPHAPLTWVEFNHLPYLKRIKELKSQGVFDRYGKDPQRMGWLVRQHAGNAAAFIAYEVRSSVRAPGQVFVHPLGMAWVADDSPSPWPRFTVDEFRETSEAVVALAGYHSTQAHWSHEMFGYDLTVEQLKMMISGYTPTSEEFSAAGKPAISLRTLWALLATINDLPVRTEIVEPSRGYIACGPYKKFFAHSLLHLTVPENKWRSIIRKADALLRRRAHQVRGHWRTDWRARPSIKCKHDWTEEMVCRNCGGHKLWIPEHQRGDASLGFVTHDYVVHHEED